MIELGMEVQCEISDFTGIAVSKIEYIGGCIQYGVKRKVGQDGKMPEVEYIDEGKLKIIGQGVRIKKELTGGDMPDCPKD